MEVKVEKVDNPYARLLYWETWNFMTLQHARFDFDGDNIINLKGYNDVGKSAALRALDVLFFDIKPNRQVNFITDDKGYTRILAYFEDGVTILRDKYLNGMSLYEMYKDSDLIFTTREGNALTRISGVPAPIKDYLGLVYYDDVYVNSRSCFELQLGIQTSGSDNYRMFNTVLRSEEIYNAANSLNTDKNALGSEITSLTAELSFMERQSLLSDYVDREVIEYLKTADIECDSLIEQESLINECIGLSAKIADLVELAEIEYLDVDRVSSISDISDKLSFLSSIPEVDSIDSLDMERLSSLSELDELIVCLSGLDEVSEIPVIDSERVNDLTGITWYLQELSTLDSIPDVSSLELDVSRLVELSTISSLVSSIQKVDMQLERSKATLLGLENDLVFARSQFEETSVGYMQCPDCGAYFMAES